MNNKYGYFKYMDFANGADENCHYSSDASLQEGASLALLERKTMPADLQAFEENSYVTDSPALFYQGNYEVGFVTSNISDGDGVFASPVSLQIDFTELFSMSGLTVFTGSVVKKATIHAYRNNQLVTSGEFSAKEKSNYYSLKMELVNKIIFTVYEIDDPYHFMRIYGVDFGRDKTFGDSDIVSATVTVKFSVIGDTLEYDTLDLRVKNPDDVGAYMFQRKQVLHYIKDNEYLTKFFVNSGGKNQDGTFAVTAYDGISILEDQYYGGMYNNALAYDIIREICSDKIPFNYNADKTITVTGYIPICTKRKALQMVLQAANLRMYKGNPFIFAPIETDVRDEIVDETCIIGQPKYKANEAIRSLSVNFKNYSKILDEVELYHWYIEQGSDVLIPFDNSAHSVFAYEVVGVDGNGDDILSNSYSDNVTFIEREANYCIVRCETDKKIVLKGRKYAETSSSVKVNNPLISRDNVYDDINIDMSIHGDVQQTCNLLYDLYSKPNTISFKTLKDLDVGGLYNILGDNYHIVKKKTLLDGVYEVEAR